MPEDSAALSPTTPARARRTPEDVRVLAIVPAYNEADSIEHVVKALREHLPTCDVVVVDDGSTDATSRQVPRDATLIRLPFNLGIGGAMQTGYRYAQLHNYDVAVQVDADGQHPPAEARRVIQELLDSDADLVIGSRFLDPEVKDYHQTASRMAGIQFLGGLIRLLTGKLVTDCTSGLRAANHRVIKAYASWYPDDYPEPEVVLLLHRAGFRIRELQVHMEQRSTGVSSISFWRGVFYVIKVSVSLLLDTIREPWPKA
jgi:glycosyltransferase involved in cell wall biosynthesis